MMESPEPNKEKVIKKYLLKVKPCALKIALKLFVYQTQL